ncbi:MAG: Uma2 family endonuclease [Aquificaceae bacterium]|nr:Uma2 family endonuclease [Aquificaceae bacterium]MCX7989262.1 Uma2 family endonuclease [Aquificaceae bacterium]MDW8032972.1 Uma2 family endonuclease [Aquificaceae bacterium]
MKTTSKVWTYEDYLKLEEDKRYEIIEGELYFMPGASRKHQRVALRLTLAFTNHIERIGLGEVYIPPFDVVLSEENVVQPDLVVVLKDSLSLVKEKGIFGVPDVVVEIVSPSSLKKDTEDKRKLYASYGVKEFWLVFPEEKVIEVFRLEGSEYKVHSWGYEKGKICSKLLEGFCISLEEVFGD